MARIVVERTFEHALTEGDLDAMEERVGGCLDLYEVRWIRSHFSIDRRRMICEYEAADAQTVRELQNAAKAPFDRVWPAQLLEPEI